MTSNFSLLRAEWQKITGNRWAAAFLVLIFPAGAFGIITLFSVIMALSETVRENMSLGAGGFFSGVQWTTQALSPWGLAGDIVARWILVAFTAVVFAGEYGWNTWKNVLHRRSRTAIITAKFAAVITFILLAFTLTSIIVGIGTGIPLAIAGIPYGPELSGEVLASFASDYLTQVCLAVMSITIMCGYAALAAMVTRTIMGGVLTAVGITLLEQVLIGILFVLSRIFNLPDLINVHRFTPGYNISNVSSWVLTQSPLDMGLGFTDTLTFSLIVLAVWAVGLFTLTVVLFRHQDIVN